MDICSLRASIPVGLNAPNAAAAAAASAAAGLAAGAAAVGGNAIGPKPHPANGERPSFFVTMS